ncbi:MAG: PAS domain S-box protein [Dehalococcoidales bacterium]|jgi:PAS domain S-box-containing protein
MRVKDQTAEQIYIETVTLRQKLEAQIRRERDRAQTFLDIAGVIIIALDAQEKIQLINKKGCQILDDNFENIIGKNWFDTFLPVRFRNEVREVHYRLMAGEIEAVEYFENPVLTRNGEERLIAWHNQVLYDDEGNITGMLSSGDDITERVQIENDLNQRVKELQCLYITANIATTPEISLEELYRKVINLLPSACQYPEIACAKLTVNDKVFHTDNCRDTRWRFASNIIVYDDQAGTLEVGYPDQRIQSGEEPFLREEKLLIDTVADLLGKTIERKQAEEMFVTLAAGSSIGVYIVQDGSFKYTNPRFQSLLGYAEAELLGASPLSYVMPSDRDLVRANAIRVLNGERSYPCEYRVFNKAGENLWILETTTQILYRGRPAILGNFMDVTERKQLEKKMVEYQEINKLKSDLLSTVSHELRTPLATIKGYATILVDYDSRLANDEKREYLHAVSGAIDRLTDLVDHLLDMSRLEAGLLNLEKIPTSISKLIKSAVSDAQLRSTGHQIVADQAKRLPKILGDSRRLRQVLDNLLDNAIKYSWKGSKVVVRAQRVGSELMVSISDEGIGIPPGDLERVFDRMYRIEQRLGSSIGGIGLGLAICRGLVEAHDGRIWMESQQGKGSTCYFTLPIR